MLAVLQCRAGLCGEQFGPRFWLQVTKIQTGYDRWERLPQGSESRATIAHDLVRFSLVRDKTGLWRAELRARVCAVRR